MVGVQAKVPSSVSQPNSPPLQVRTLFEVQVVRPAPLKLAVKRLEEEATVEKKLVVVARVPVAFVNVKVCRVDDARENIPALNPIKVEVAFATIEPKEVVVNEKVPAP